MKQLFIVLMDAQGKLLPSAFISRCNDAGWERAKSIKLGENDKLVVVEMVITEDYPEAAPIGGESTS